jgi:Lanthionine-containing peptide SapB precursor RamS
MALLDIQAMVPARDSDETRCDGSNLSVALCDSVVSLTLCL